MQRKQAQAVGHVIEDGQGLGLEKGALGHGRWRPGGGRQAFEVSGGLVPEVADHAALEPGQLWQRGDGRGGDCSKCFQGVAAVHFEGLGPVADEGVAGQALAALHTLEQKPRLPRRAQQCVRANGGQHVGQHLPVDRDQRMALG